MKLQTLSIALVALMALSGFAAAQEPSSSPPSPHPCSPSTTNSCPPPSCSPSGTTSCPPPCGGPDHPCPSTTCKPDPPCSDPEFQRCMRESNRTSESEKACKDAYCSRNQNDFCAGWHCQQTGEGCPPKPTPSPKPTPTAGNGGDDRQCLARAESDPQREACKKYCSNHAADCKQFCDNHPDARMCVVKPSGDERHITFEATADGQGIANLTVNGHLILASVRMEATGAFESKRSDNTLVVLCGDNRLELHDDAAGFLRFEGPDATVTLVFPAGVTHELGPAGHRAFVQYPGGGMALIESDNMTWVDDHTVAITRFFSFHVTGGEGQPAPNNALGIKVKEAVVRGDKVGAEVRVNHGDGSEVFAYDRVNVTLRPSLGRPSSTDPLRIVLSSDLGAAGRSIVLHINKTVLDVAEDRVVLHYYDLPEGANDTATRTEVVFQRASSLDDVLDPSNDNGQPEYWVVRDANGLEVIVSVPHWSVHMVELSGLADLVQPSVLIGIAAGAAGVMLAAVVLFVPRRRED